MATVEWVAVKRIWCDRIGKEAELMEQRVYPADHLSDAEPYHIKARKCSWGMDCNLAGYRCRWSFLNPAYDPFGLEGSEF